MGAKVQNVLGTETSYDQCVKKLRETSEFIQKNYGIRDEEILLMMKNAIDTAFADDSIKDKICKMLK